MVAPLLAAIAAALGGAGSAAQSTGSDLLKMQLAASTRNPTMFGEALRISGGNVVDALNLIAQVNAGAKVGAETAITQGRAEAAVPPIPSSLFGFDVGNLPHTQSLLTQGRARQVQELTRGALAGGLRESPETKRRKQLVSTLEKDIRSLDASIRSLESKSMLDERQQAILSQWKQDRAKLAEDLNVILYGPNAGGVAAPLLRQQAAPPAAPAALAPAAPVFRSPRGDVIEKVE